MAVDTLLDTLVGGVMSGLAGKEFNFWESLQKNGWANIVAMSIHDPVDAVSGAYVIQTTNVILASLPFALKLERTYRSTGNDISAFGKGWTFSYGSRIYRDTGNSRRIHLDAITGHSLCFEAQEGKWVNTSWGASQYSLKVTDDNHFLLTNHQEHTVCVYDREGYLVRVEYPNRQHLTFIYNEEGLSRIVTPLGVWYLENEYDRQGWMIRQRFQDGSVAEVIYDDSKRINTSINRANGRKEIYRYNRDQLVEQVLYEDGTSLTMEYSEQCLPVARSSRTGARTVWEYDSFGNVIREVQPDGYERHYEYDHYGNCIRIHYADGGTERRFYDSDGNLVRQVLLEAYDPGKDDGPEFVYTYDRSGRLTCIQDPEGNQLEKYEYNGHGQVIREEDGEGKKILYAYNGLGLKIREQVSIRKEDDNTWYWVIRYDYDLQGNKIEEAYGQNEVMENQEPSGWHRIRFGYDKNNYLTSVEDDFWAKVRYECMTRTTN